MKISLEWLESFTPATGSAGALSAQAVADALTAGGLNVESVVVDGSDSVLDVEVTSNRGDCLSHIGIAREVAALLNRPLKITQSAAKLPAEAGPVPVSIESPQRCPHYTARLIRGVKIQPSPPAIARRLSAVGLRPINNVVDVTNYVLMEMGQPLHAFDFANLKDSRIVVRDARAGETLLTLDGHTQKLSPSMLVIADASRPVALAGIMGGAESQVTDATTDILLESARFDPLTVRRASRALGLRSDSSYRFERGIDPTLPMRASLRATELILETSGGTVTGGLSSAGADGFKPKQLQLRLSRLSQLLGTAIPTDEVVRVLSLLELSPVLDGQTIKINVPSWRLDLNIEADIIEEVARLIGYDRLPLRQEISIRLQPPDPGSIAVETIRQTLIASGFFEAVTFSFVSDALKDDFFPAGKMALKADASVRKADATLRPSILPGLLEAVRRNEANGTPDARLYEIGSIFSAGSNGKPDEKRTVAMVGGADWRDSRGVVEVLLNKLDAAKPIRFIADNRAGFEAGACSRIEWNASSIGFAGMTARSVAEKLSLRQPPYGCELDLNALIQGTAAIAQLKPLPQFPPARRDLSLVVDESTPYERIEQTLLQSKPAYLHEIEYVTTYRGKPLEAGKKSVTVTLVFRLESGTLTSEQVEASVATAFAAAAEELGATLRQ
jgi:phenylalanyl-tRNA synthetase beta chain